jgi:hypothetical protein
VAGVVAAAGTLMLLNRPAGLDLGGLRALVTRRGAA